AAADRAGEAEQARAALRAGDARRRLAIEAAGFATWEMDLRHGTMVRSGAIIPGQPGLPLSDFTLEALLALIHSEDRDRVGEAIGAIVSGNTDRARTEYRVARPGGGWIWIETHGGVVERDEPGGRPLRLAGVARDVTERRAAEAALRASEARLRVALDAARFSTWEYDVRADQGTRQGDLAAALPQVPAAGVSLAAWLEQIHPEDRAAARAAIEALIAGAIERMTLEFRVRRPDGGWACIESAGAALERDPVSGAVLRIAGVARDVTEQRLAAERQALLAREVDHRAKNALAVVQAALRLTPRGDPAAYAAAVEGRVRALARAHTLLAEARWQGASLHALAEGELAAFLTPAPGSGSGGARATVEGPELILVPSVAQGLSMALHELATNATKYGALSADGGRVELRWRVDEARAQLRLCWTERDGPPVTAPPERRGFGSRVIEATVRDQLGGRLTQHWHPAGLACEIEIPLARALGVTLPAGAAVEPPRASLTR
ncbi:MAG: PAS domain-containing protein, partial [Acetobacteraceae bacterium]|nr:PAS domain-containing protein [Acetobacteraceae bacterium]